MLHVINPMAALELISDTFLPVNEIAQFAVPEIFRRGQGFLAQYKNWVSKCRSPLPSLRASNCSSADQCDWRVAIK